MLTLSLHPFNLISGAEDISTGGKERMTTYFNEVGWPSQIPENDRKAFIQVYFSCKRNLFHF
jgi:hypothetical protein